MRTRLIKGVSVVLGAIVLSTLGIFASDTLTGVDALSRLGSVGSAGRCKEGAVPMKVQNSILCVDVYESSPSSKCAFKNITNIMQSEENLRSKDCYAVSVGNAIPWNFVSLPQAQRACAAAGKRLPTSEEWYRLALGTNESACIVRSISVEKTGTEGCVSTLGIYDAVGNVWEWVDENVQGKKINERDLPDEGYVTSVDADGVAITSGQSPDDLYGKDYFWTKSEGVFGMIRGGFYGGGDDAGIYATNASVVTSFATQGIGFRCVEDIL